MGFFETSSTQPILGQFTNVHTNRSFEYRKTTNEWALQHGYTHEIALNFNLIRYANVKATVVYVAVDEDERGQSIEQKWRIKQHHHYV